MFNNHESTNTLMYTNIPYMIKASCYIHSVICQYPIMFCRSHHAMAEHAEFRSNNLCLFVWNIRIVKHFTCLPTEIELRVSFKIIDPSRIRYTLDRKVLFSLICAGCFIFACDKRMPFWNCSNIVPEKWTCPGGVNIFQSCSYTRHCVTWHLWQEWIDILLTTVR